MLKSDSSLEVYIRSNEESESTTKWRIHMARSTLAKARPAIAKFFDKAETPVFRRGDLSGILRECRHAWELAKSVNVDDWNSPDSPDKSLRCTGLRIDVQTRLD